MSTNRKTRTIVRKSPATTRVKDGKRGGNSSRVLRKSDGGTLNPGPGKHKDKR